MSSIKIIPEITAQDVLMFEYFKVVKVISTGDKT